MKHKRLKFYLVLALAMLLLLALTGTAWAEPGDEVILTVELNEWYSCPFLFTWDGESWQIENDLFSVGRGAEREYTDYLMLNNLVVPQDGRYCFEIREVPSEESWTDMLKLITIDHPAAMSAGVDSSGNAHTYSNPAAPQSAVDGSGNDVSTVVASRDDVGVAMYEGDVVVLDFSSVDITAAAKLVVAVDGFEDEAMGSPTGKVPAIEIQTLEAGSWVTRHTFYPKEFWAEGVFDLQPYLGESQAVRLLSVSCDEGKNHVLDFVGLDNTPDVLSSSLLEPVTALLNGETDVLGDVSNSDDVYVHTANDDTIVICFPAAPLADEARSFGFVSEGYYTPTGNTYYVDTWNGSSWVYRAYLASGFIPNDTIRSANLTAYLPDPDGEFKVRIRNSMSWAPIYANVDWVSLTVGGTENPIVSAMEYDTTDILSLVMTSDDVKWNAMNKWAVIEFEPPNQPPVADPNGPYYGNEGSPVTFDGTGSYDPDSDPLTYDWDFGDGTIMLDAGPTPNHTYDDNGVYDICLTVTDPGGLSDTQCASTTPMNVVFALDSSGSMAWNDPSGLRRTASKDFVDKMDAAQDLAGVVSWDYYIDFAYPLSSDFATVKSQIDMVNSSGGTNLDVGLNAAIGLLDSGKQTGASWVIIMLSNGEGTYTGGPTADAAAKGYIIYSIGLGSAPATAFLTDMATQTGGQYYPAPTAENLQAIFDDIYVTVSGKAYISNVAPTATFNAPSEVNEGDDISLSLTDPNDPSNADTFAGFEYAFDCGDGSGYGAWSSTNSVVCSTDDNEVRTVKGKIRDKDGGTTGYTADVTVNNVAPTVSIDSVAPSLVAVGATVTAAGSFTDPGTNDTHTVEWDWGDGSADSDNSHAYGAAGIYTIQLTVTDDDGGVGIAEYQFVVVYDPSAGFVTGGGWIDSPAGAYIPDQTLAGKANFGFVSKYKKGTTVPEGNTEFQFHAAGLNFHSASYEWLVVTGSNYAKFKGVGTINGMGEYKFMIWAGDNSTDTFRIKIWEEDEYGVETVIYDNGTDQAIGGGSIVIHTKK